MKSTVEVGMEWVEGGGGESSHRLSLQCCVCVWFAYVTMCECVGVLSHTDKMCVYTYFSTHHYVSIYTHMCRCASVYIILHT